MRSHNSGNIHDENLHIWAVERKKSFLENWNILSQKNHVTCQPSKMTIILQHSVFLFRDVTIGFRALNWTSRETYNDEGENSSVETLGSRERKLVTISWYTVTYFKWAFTDVRDKAAIWFHSRLLFIEHSNIHHARVKANL